MELYRLTTFQMMGVGMLVVQDSIDVGWAFTAASTGQMLIAKC